MSCILVLNSVKFISSLCRINPQRTFKEIFKFEIMNFQLEKQNKLCHSCSKYGLRTQL